MESKNVSTVIFAPSSYDISIVKFLAPISTGLFIERYFKERPQPSCVMLLESFTILLAL